MTFNRKDIYLQINPEDVWSHFGSLSGVLRGGGGAPRPAGAGPKLVTGNVLKAKDFLVVHENGEKFVLPHTGSGLSFSTTLERLEGKTGAPRILGRVWKLEKGTTIPDGLCVNFDRNEPDHPMISVSRKMRVSDAIELFDVLASKMKPTNVKLK